MAFPSSPAVFIGGTGRSGTTLAVDLLGLHPRLSPIYETEFVVHLAAMLFGAGAGPPRPEAIRRLMERWCAPLPRRPHHKRDHERYHHGPHYVLFTRSEGLAATERFITDLQRRPPQVALRRLVDTLFGQHAALDGKARWVNKTPNYGHILPVLHAMYPKLRFVHCVRDGRDVGLSVRTRRWGPDTMAEVPGWWKAQMAPTLAFAEAHPECVRHVRYEDLVGAPQETLTSLLEWLGEAPFPPMFRRVQEGPVRLDPARLGAWRNALSPAEVDDFAAKAGATLTRFGYPLR